jgi:hypothetical protein
MALAEGLAASVGAAEEDRQDMIAAALLVGRWLADQGRPGRWDTVDPAAVLAFAGFTNAHDRERFLFALAGLVGHAGCNGQLPPATAQACLERVAELAGNEVTSRFARHVARQVLPQPC